MTDRITRIIIRGDITDLKAKLAAGGQSVKAFAAQTTSAEKESAKWRRGLDDVGAAGGRMSLAIGAGLGLAAKAAIDWETAWAGVTKTVDGTAEQMATLEGELRDLATTLPATHAEIAAVAEAAGQLGVAREDIAEFTRTMIDLGETTNLTSDEAATSIAQMANVMQTAPEDISRVGAALVALGNDGASTERDIIQMSQRIAGAGAQIGLAESDILAIANAAASMGVEVEAGGTAVSTIFTKMAKAVAQGGPMLERFADTAGIASSEFVAAFQDDPAQAFATFIGGLDRINKSGGDVFTTLQNLKLSDVRVSQALLGMAASGDLLTDSLTLGAQAWEENTALADEAAKRYDTDAARIKVAMNEVRDTAIEFGAVIAPIVTNAAELVGGLADAFGALPGPVQDGVAALAGVAAVVGGGLWFTSKTISGVASMRESLSNLGFTGDKAEKSMTRAGKAMQLLGKTTVAVTAIAAITDAFNGVNDEFERTIELQEAAAGDTAAQIDALTAELEKQQKIAEKGVSLDIGVATLFSSDDAANAADRVDFLKDRIADLRHQQDLAAVTAEGATKATEKLTGATGALGNKVTLTAEQQEELAKALEESREAARDTANAFVGVGKSVSDNKVTLKGWIKDMRESAEALKNFRLNAQEAAKKGLDEGLIAALQEAGPEGALRMRQLSNATKEEIAAANDAWRSGQREVQKYTNQVGGVPKDVATTLHVNTNTAALDSLQYRLNRLAAGYTIPLRVAEARAAGGPVYGPGTSTSDSIPAMLSNGEFVMKADAVAKYGLGMMHAINAERFAAGGYASRGERAGAATYITNQNAQQWDSFRNAEDMLRALRTALGEQPVVRVPRNTSRELAAVATTLGAV